MAKYFIFARFIIILEYKSSFLMFRFSGLCSAVNAIELRTMFTAFNQKLSNNRKNCAAILNVQMRYLSKTALQYIFESKYFMMMLQT